MRRILLEQSVVMEEWMIGFSTPVISNCTAFKINKKVKLTICSVVLCWLEIGEKYFALDIRR